MTSALNLADVTDRQFLLRTIELASAASDAQDDRETDLLPQWESSRDLLDRLGCRLRTAVESIGLSVETINRGTDDDGWEVDRPLTVRACDEDGNYIVIDLAHDWNGWSITEVEVVP